MRIAMRTLAASLAVLLLAGSASAQSVRMPKVDLSYDEAADFSKFQTYAWKSDAPVAEKPEMHTRIVWYVEGELQKKGLKKAASADKADLLVSYYAKGKEKVQGDASQGETYLPGGTNQLSTSINFHKVLSGTLILELKRASDGAPVWRAGSEYRALEKDKIDAETRAAVRMLMARYPPKK
jgi:hypothetical protein